MEDLKTPKNHSEINWPLAKEIFYADLLNKKGVAIKKSKEKKDGLAPLLQYLSVVFAK